MVGFPKSEPADCRRIGQEAEQEIAVCGAVLGSECRQKSKEIEIFRTFYNIV
jgi:hypothetical protein